MSRLSMNISFKNFMTPNEAEDPPIISITSVDNAYYNAYYTLLMIDLDAPSKISRVYSPWLHWLVINIPGKDLKIGKINKGITIAEYSGPTPPKGSGNHEYKILLFKQDVLINPKIKNNIKFRNNFSIDSVIQSNILHLVSTKSFLSAS